MQMHKRIKSYIDDRQLSQKIIAANMGIQESKLSLILNGKRRMSVDDYESICRAMAVDPARFYQESKDDLMRTSR